MEKTNYYTSEEIRPLYDEIIPAYQIAFAGEPWYEVSKCADRRRRCAGGLSAVAVGSLCSICSERPALPAYETDELKERFDTLGLTRPTMWYVEQQLDDRVNLASVAWRATPSRIAEEKYADVPEMKEWLAEKFKDDPEITWLDDIFANRDVKANGNLNNFGELMAGLAGRLDTKNIAYRTIAPQMARAAIRDFGDRATVLERSQDVPDRRNFIIINLEGE